MVIFAQWKTTPAPSWTVFRDNTMHHYARPQISGDAIEVEVFGVSGDGRPPVVQDSFQIRQSGCK